MRHVIIEKDGYFTTDHLSSELLIWYAPDSALIILVFRHAATRGALNDLLFFIFIKMFTLKLQARNPKKLLQAKIQSHTRIKISMK